MTSGGEEDFILVAAIDFGTTFSGYAFSFIATKENPDLPESIRINKSWGASLGFQSYKTPTAVLTTKSGEFLDFGFDAENKYSTAIEDDEDREPDMLLFRHFKMLLHKNENVKLNANVSSVDGTIKPALEIFSHALRYLKDHLLKAIKLEIGRMPDQSLIRWVITVPAIWSDESKQFMREVAFKAGCTTEKDSKRLVIALEPEAASLYCRRLSVAQYESTNDVSFPVGTKYLVLDCGGGTIDITAHVTEFDKKVKEILHASGGSWGGTRVDHNFVEFLESVLGKYFLNSFRQQCPQQWLQFLTNFEKMKKSFQPDGESKIFLSLPWSMRDLYPNINEGQQIEKVIKSASGKGIRFSQGSIIIKYEAARKFFDPVINEIVIHVKKLVCDPKLRGLRYILMVGGFSECPLLQNAIIQAFEGNGLKVLVPGEAQLAIIKGAVLFGHTPSEIKARVARKTYGCAVKCKFDPEIHESPRKFTDKDGVDKVCNFFSVFITKGSEVLVGVEYRKAMCVTEFENSGTVSLFATDLFPVSEVKYVDEDDMHKIGRVTIDNLKSTGSKKYIDVIWRFGSTEVQVEAVEVSTGKCAHTTIDFLSH